MFAILSYDINEKRVGKVEKIVKKYLWQVHRSVYNGHLSEKQLQKLKNQLARVTIPSEDSVCIYTADTEKVLQIQTLGRSSQTDHIIL